MSILSKQVTYAYLEAEEGVLSSGKFPRDLDLSVRCLQLTETEQQSVGTFHLKVYRPEHIAQFTVRQHFNGHEGWLLSQMI